jgi:acyl-CoA synthetase (AMP-forming)/AMP-acid ligase II
MPLLDRFLTSVDLHTDSVAVVDESGHHTYRNLATLAQQVTNYLRERNITPGDRVALLLANSFEYIGVFYGIWASGGITVALNTQAKARDLTNWLDHSGCRILFVDEKHPELEELQQHWGGRLHTVPVSPKCKQSHTANSLEVWNGIVSCETNAPPYRARSDEIASIIYTSGTTGSPKGVTLSHGNLEANTGSILRYLALTSSDSIVNVLPFYYSYGNSVLHTHLAVGGRLVLENSLLYPQQVLSRIRDECVTGFSGVPSTFSLLINRTKLHDFDLSCLRYITQAGGPMPPATTDKLLQAIPGVDLFIMYGQTEASARLSYLPPRDLKRKRGSIGIPIPGVSIELRDSNGLIDTPYATGEICAKGDNVMLGYWRDETKTKKVLCDNWLHTGDLAHFDDEGFLYIDGRSSDMIKSGGNRISPQEIEETICELDGIFEVAVKGIKDDLLGEIIKAYVVLEHEQALSKMDIQRYCKQNLAMYKIPKTIEFIDAIPRTASGKILRHLLK